MFIHTDTSIYLYLSKLYSIYNILPFRQSAPHFHATHQTQYLLKEQRHCHENVIFICVYLQIDNDLSFSIMCVVA